MEGSHSLTLFNDTIIVSQLGKNVQLRLPDAKDKLYSYFILLQHGPLVLFFSSRAVHESTRNVGDESMINEFGEKAVIKSLRVAVGKCANASHVWLWKDRT
jgi:hypothetical protein